MDVTGTPLELWGGFECTVARIGDRFRDQMRETGHRGRMADLDAVARLGLRTLRYPVLWETVAPHAPDVRDWSWHDARLAHLRRLGIDPIAGLLHHGSGPMWTDLLDPAFPELFAGFAAAEGDRAGKVARDEHIAVAIHRRGPGNAPAALLHGRDHLPGAGRSVVYERA